LIIFSALQFEWIGRNHVTKVKDTEGTKL